MGRPTFGEGWRFVDEWMNIQVAVLCDAATDDNGKLNLLGAFDTIYAQQMPVTHPCVLALRLTIGHEDEGEHQLRLSFVDADGRSIMPEPIELSIRVALPLDSHFGTRNIIIQQGLLLENPGLYSIDLRVDGEPQTSIPLLVKQRPAPM